MQKSLINQWFSGCGFPITSTNFKTASLWPLRYPSVYELPLGRYHRIIKFFRNIFRNAVFGFFRSARKASVYKAFWPFCDLSTRKFSRPPRYDHFDIPPNEMRRGLRCGSITAGERIHFATYAIRRNIPPYIWKAEKLYICYSILIGDASLCTVAVPEFFCSRGLTKFRPLSLLVVRCICRSVNMMQQRARQITLRDEYCTY